MFGVVAALRAKNCRQCEAVSGLSGGVAKANSLGDCRPDGEGCALEDSAKAEVEGGGEAVGDGFGTG